MRTKLLNWETKNIPTLPLSSLKTISSWSGAVFGLIFIFTGALKIFDFSGQKSLIASTFISITIGIIMWNIVKNLMLQVDSGQVKEIDEYF